MPAGMQKVEGQLPGPPAFRSSLIPSQTLVYSGVSGGWPASGIQLLGLPTRTHCPLKFGYFPTSTWAADGVANSAINATAPRILAPRILGPRILGPRILGANIVRTCMRCPPCIRPIGAARAFGAHVIAHRWQKPPSVAPTIHRPPAGVEGALSCQIGLHPATIWTRERPPVWCSTTQEDSIMRR